MAKKSKPLSRGEKVIAFITEFCRTPEGSKVGEPIVLADFQKKFIIDIYDNPNGTRRAYLSIARKNGKSALIAAILLAHVCGPEAKQNSQIVSGAMSRDQAALVFALASKMINLDQRLQRVCRIVPSKKSIVGLARNVEYRALAADGTTAHGLSPVLAILDECGQVRGPTSDFIEAITTSQGAHDEPLLIAISTSAPSDADMFSLWCDDAVRSGNTKVVCHVYKADENCDLMDQEQWKKANPALGVFRSFEDLETQLSQAANLPALEASARNLLLNQRVALESLWLAPGPWKACGGAIDEDVFRKYPVALGLDLSMRTDLTAAVLAAQDEEGVVHLKPFVFAPISGMDERERRDKVPYQQWVRDGYMIGVPGTTVDYAFVAQWLRDTLDDADISVGKVCFDRWRIDVFKAACSEVGAFSFASWIEIGQGFRDMSPRLESFEALMLSGKLRHGSHPLLNMAASNAIATRDPAGNRKLDKSKATQRIDPLVACIMSVHEVSEGRGEVLGNDLSWMVA